MMTVSLRDFLVSSCLGEVSFSLEESEVIRRLGLPDDTLKFDVGSPDETTASAIYGCLTIQYTRATQLEVMTVVVEHERFPQISPELRIDPSGIFRGMSPEQFATWLRQDSIEFITKVTSTQRPVFQIFNQADGVHVLFQHESSGDFVIWYLSAYGPNFHLEFHE